MAALIASQGLGRLPTPQIEIFCCSCAPGDCGWQCLYTGHAIEHANPTDAEASDLIACRLGACDHAEFLESYQYRLYAYAIDDTYRYRVRVK